MRGAPPRELIDAVVRSLENDDGWILDKYEATHRQSGTVIWIASGMWGLEIEVGGLPWGGVTALSTFFGWAIPWRRRLLAAVRVAALRKFARSMDANK